MVGEAAVEETEQVQFYQLEITHIHRHIYLIGPMNFLTALLDFLSFLSCFVYYPQTVKAIRGENCQSNKTTRA